MINIQNDVLNEMLMNKLHLAQNQAGALFASQLSQLLFYIVLAAVFTSFAYILLWKPYEKEKSAMGKVLMQIWFFWLGGCGVPSLMLLYFKYHMILTTIHHLKFI
jgi:hypothetical protein